ncbi:MAG: GerMN domain-containing protein, partial [Anaerolineales bacterium]
PELLASDTPLPTLEPMVTLLPSPTSTLPPTPTSPPSPTPTITPLPMMTITVYFTDQNAYLAATPPYEVGVTRTVPFSYGIARTVLTEFFNGPTPAEAASGLVLITSGATGFSNVTIHDTIARVYLTGNCNSQGATYTIANPLYANMIQFSTVSYVKIYDQNGNTQQPSGYTNSIPACLEP